MLYTNNYCTPCGVFGPGHTTILFWFPVTCLPCHYCHLKGKPRASLSACSMNYFVSRPNLKSGNLPSLGAKVAQGTNIFARRPTYETLVRLPEATSVSNSTGPVAPNNNNTTSQHGPRLLSITC